jgi:hypothetical protein
VKITSSSTAPDFVEPLWMACRKGGDVMVRWEDLTDAEQLDAIAHHNKLYPQQETTS